VVGLVDIVADSWVAWEYCYQVHVGGCAMVEYWKLPFPFVLGLFGIVGDSSSVASVHYHIQLVWATVALVPPVEHCYTPCEFVAHDENVGPAAEIVEVARREVEEEAAEEESRVAAPSWSLPSSDWRNRGGR